MPDVEKRYWDSSVFLALIKKEPGLAATCENILNDARAGRCEIYTSMITLTEVVKRRAKENPIDPKTEATISAFFRNTFIKLVPVDLVIATRARRLIWDFPWLGARDAIHIATALVLKIPALEHYDDDDIGKVAARILAEKLPGFPVIRHPEWKGQLSLTGEEAPTPPETSTKAAEPPEPRKATEEQRQTNGPGKAEEVSEATEMPKPPPGQETS